MQTAQNLQASPHSLIESLKAAPLIIWDKDGTITGSKNPNDTGTLADQYLPNVMKIMRRGQGINIICSGCKTPESELQNFDPEKVAAKLELLMADLPIAAATFSPAIGGVECYVLLKVGEEVELIKAHEQERYKKYVGQFKKPGVGMLMVIQDLIAERLESPLDTKDIIFIGDTWHDKEAAQAAGMQFVQAQDLHGL